jgi:hypothetical protein
MRTAREVSSKHQAVKNIVKQIIAFVVYIYYICKRETPTGCFIFDYV